MADHACECCPIALAPLPDGGVALLWRQVFEPGIRDRALVVFWHAREAPLRVLGHPCER